MFGIHTVGLIMIQLLFVPHKEIHLMQINAERNLSPTIRSLLRIGVIRIFNFKINDDINSQQSELNRP